MTEKLKMFEWGSKIGEGVSGKVFSVKHTKTGKQFALKKFHLKNDLNGIPQGVIREISILKNIDHINVIHLYDIIHDKNRIYTLHTNIYLPAVCLISLFNFQKF